LCQTELAGVTSVADRDPLGSETFRRICNDLKGQISPVSIIVTTNPGPTFKRRKAVEIVLKNYCHRCIIRLYRYPEKFVTLIKIEIARKLHIKIDPGSGRHPDPA